MGIMDTVLLVFGTQWSFPPCFPFFFSLSFHESPWKVLDSSCSVLVGRTAKIRKKCLSNYRSSKEPWGLDLVGNFESCALLDYFLPYPSIKIKPEKAFLFSLG